MPKYVLTLRIGLNDSETSYEQAAHLRDLLTEIALGMAPGGEGSVGSMIEDTYQLEVKQSAAEHRLRTQLREKHFTIAQIDETLAVLKRVGYVPQA